MNVIELHQVSKVFQRRVTAVDSLDLAVPSGQIFGFLGPNGAGKSTTIRMILDLIHPTAGSVHLFGEDIRDKPHGLKKIGALVENAAFYPFLSGRDNLRALALNSSMHKAGRIDEVLDRVGMYARADERVSGYSTGMKQRLGIAAALLTEPELVILDEPTNGLDPAGMIEIRQFIRALAETEGITVFLSSHLLTEVEQICDRVAIIHKGRLVSEGKITDLLSDTMEDFRLQVSNPQQAAAILHERWEIRLLEKPGWLQVAITPGESPAVIRRLVEQDIDVHQAVLQKQSLEDLFLSLTVQDGAHD